jgi:UDP-GlcNAc:undecaprenyl-phosphate GlcNAc-1-phosphate transferase
MIKKFFGFTLLCLYCLVLAVAMTNGPLVSFQSLILGIIGLIVITIGISTLAKAINLVDIPDNIRKLHIGNVPLIGGIVIFISVVYGTFVFGVDPFYRYVIISLVPILIVGTIDGIRAVAVPISFRLIAQILASWMVILFTDVYLKDLGNLFGQGTVYLNQFGIPFTIFAVVGMCNAFNMLDGKDGLAGSVAVVIISSLLLLLYLNGIIYNWGLILILSLAVFLAFNMNLFGQERKIFLGEHGSSSLGHLIAWNLVYLSQATDFITPVTALWFVFFPLTDALLTIMRRVKISQSIVKADRRHLHYLLSDRGFSDQMILLGVVLLSIIGVTTAVVANLLNIQEYYLFYAYITVVVCLWLSSRIQS